MGPDQGDGGSMVGQRRIPEEPMVRVFQASVITLPHLTLPCALLQSIVLNLGISCMCILIICGCLTIGLICWVYSKLAKD